ncbi:MAG: helical backbone metal receptor [Bacteroidota bacterium]|nr:helical backbone metal receptor [Bacteroidota bacterium]
MPVFKDQLGNEVHLDKIPNRIISLVPSQTELLFDLGLNEEIVGITKFCIHPPSKVKKIAKIGGTKNFNFEKINSLHPDLIIANKEENYKEGVLQLSQSFPVWVSDIKDLDEAYTMIEGIGSITDKSSAASEIIGRIKKDLEAIKINKKKKALYLIWKNPYMSIGGDTFINQMLEYAGFENLLNKSRRYPQISPEEIAFMAPEYILLSSEPYPFKEKHINEFQKISPKSKIMVVDGEMFSWYGSRLQYSAKYFKELNFL